MTWLRCCCRRAGGWAWQSLARDEEPPLAGDAVSGALGCTRSASGTWWRAAAGTRSSTLQAGVGMN